MTVGQAAHRSGLSAKAVRLYEARGLLPPAPRSDAGYRLFTEADVAVLCFIRRAKALGLRLGEIRDVLELQRGGEQPCDRVVALLDDRITDIDRALADLRQLRRTMVSARAAADESRRQGGAAVVCRIIEDGPSADSRL